MPGTRQGSDGLADQEFNFEGEFALLDIGATSSLLKAGNIRPTVLAFTATAGVDAVALEWDSNDGIQAAFEEARRFVRDKRAVAYAVISQAAQTADRLVFRSPATMCPDDNEVLAIAMFADDGNGRGLCYPVRRGEHRVTFGMPTVTDADTTEWCPVGDPWGNPFCIGDLVQFRRGDRAVDPSTQLWRTIVELTRLRIHEDQDASEEYMAFLDDLRNGIFVVSGRPMGASRQVQLRPRTCYNPLGTLTVDASRLQLAQTGADGAQADAR